MAHYVTHLSYEAKMYALNRIHCKICKMCNRLHVLICILIRYIFRLQKNTYVKNIDLPVHYLFMCRSVYSAIIFVFLDYDEP
jgi:hypothetical protein